MQNSLFFSCIHGSMQLQLISFFAKLLNKLYKDHNQGKRLNLHLGLLNYMSFRSSLQSHPLWVTLYIYLSGAQYMILELASTAKKRSTELNLFYNVQWYMVKKIPLIINLKYIF